MAAFVSVSPAEWIPLAEEVGVINKIGRWVLDSAIHYLESLQQSNLQQQQQQQDKNKNKGIKELSYTILRFAV